MRGEGKRQTAAKTLAATHDTQLQYLEATELTMYSSTNDGTVRVSGSVAHL